MKNEHRDKIGALLGRCETLYTGAQYLNSSSPQFSYFSAAIKEIMGELRAIHKLTLEVKQEPGITFPLQGKYKNVEIPVDKEVKEIAQISLDYMRAGKYHAGEALLQYVVWRLKDKNA